MGKTFWEIYPNKRVCLYDVSVRPSTGDGIGRAVFLGEESHGSVALRKLRFSGGKS